MSAFEDDSKTNASILPASGYILCCLCGVSITPNAVAMCSTCMQQQPEFLSFPSEINQEIIQCPKCDRWSVSMHSDHVWAAHEMESQGLLSACMKKIHSFNQQHDIKILDAAWIWTEPHSKRLKFYVDTERLIFEQRLPIKQRVLCNYVIKNSQCKDCIIKNSDHTWSAQLQIRQSRGKEHTQNIEQLLIQQKLGALMNDVKMVRDGIDLYFDSKQSLEKVSSVLQKSLPCVIRSTSKKLISRDAHTSTARTEYVVVLEVVPLLKHDIVLVSKPHLSSKSVGIVRRVASTVQISLLSTNGSRRGIHTHHISITAEKFFKNPISVLIPTGNRYLSRFIVLDVTMLTQHISGGDESTVSLATTQTVQSGRLSRAVVDVMSEENTDVQYSAETDIGHVLTPGDTVMAYDTRRLLSSMQEDDYDTSGMSSSSSGKGSAGISAADGYDLIPDVVIVSKVFDEDHKAKKRVSGGGGKKKRNRIPPWRRATAAAAGSTMTGESLDTITEENTEEGKGHEDDDYDDTNNDDGDDDDFYEDEDTASDASIVSDREAEHLEDLDDLEEDNSDEISDNKEQVN